LVGVWKGVIKPVALAGLAFTAVAAFFHWITAGPNEVEPEDEVKGRALLEKGRGLPEKGDHAS